MKRNRLGQILLGGIIVCSPISLATAQGAQLLNNYGFENANWYSAYPTFCLPTGSGHGGFGSTVPIEDYFYRVDNWISHYHPDDADCNCYASFQKAYAHSPDWLRGDCSGGWDQISSAGMLPYEVIWQNFGGGLETNKCYEVRIKIQLYTFSTFTSSPKTLDVILGTYPFFYRNDLQGYAGTSATGTSCNEADGHACVNCDQNYMEYSVSPVDEYQALLQFPASDILALGSSHYFPYSYGDWFEFHGKINMSNFSSSFPLANFVQFGLDFRDPIIANGFCDGPYLQIDQVEFFESCPNHYEIQAATIAGPQEEYIAAEDIRAGNLGKGNAIVALNGKTSFKAKNYIELVPGFLSDQGSVLEIMPNVDCAECKRVKNLAMPNHNNNSNVQIENFNKINSDRDTRNCSIYPNPTADYCSVTLQNEVINSIEILDSKSQQINLIENINKNQYQLDISYLQAGIYYIIVQTSENEEYLQRLVKI